jgi:hypothetical protein
MNRIFQVLLTLAIIGIAASGPAWAGNPDQRDVNFIKSTSHSTTSEGGDVDAWASAGIVSSSDHEFVSRETGNAAVVTAAVQTGGPGVTVEGDDYRRVAGDGSPGATCDIALVAAISSAC